MSSFDVGTNEVKKASLRKNLFPCYDFEVNDLKGNDDLPNFLWPFTNELLHLEREETIQSLLQISADLS